MNIDSLFQNRRQCELYDETRRILHLSNHGVLEFHNGNVAQSIQAFRHALTAYQRLSESLDEYDAEMMGWADGHSDGDSYHAPASVSSMPTVSTGATTIGGPVPKADDVTMELPSTMSRPNQNASSCLMEGNNMNEQVDGPDSYLRPIHMDVDYNYPRDVPIGASSAGTNASAPRHHRWRRMVACILIFNLAVSTHAVALSTRNRHDAIADGIRLRKGEALSASWRLYELTFQLLVEIEDDDDDDDADDDPQHERPETQRKRGCTLLLRRQVLLTVLYCMGQLQSLSRRPEQAKKYYGYLYVLLLQLSQKDGICEQDFPIDFCLDGMYNTLFEKLGMLSAAVTAPGA